MTKTQTTCLILSAVFVLVGKPVTAAAQSKDKLTVALYAPSANFKNSQARLTYVQGLAKAIATRTGISTTGRAYVSYTDLRRAKPDFAIIDGLCLATQRPGPVLASAVVGGKTSQAWGLFVRTKQSFAKLKGAKLAYVKTGCRDGDFLDHAMLESEVVTKKFFSKKLAKPDVRAAVATVRDFKQADAVFAPRRNASGLTLVFSATSAPTPGFVVLNSKVAKATVTKATSAVISYSAGGGIDAWKSVRRGSYASLLSKMRARTKKPIFAKPRPVVIGKNNVVRALKSSFDRAAVGQHFWEPRVGR